MQSVPRWITPGTMPRYALCIEYHGGPFAGWQRQSAQVSVQGAVEAALDRLEPVQHLIAAAGRTDAGVHSTGQVAHADMTRDWGTVQTVGGAERPPAGCPCRGDGLRPGSG